MYLGVHFPGDILIGFLIGLGCCFLLNFLFDKFHGTYWFYIISGIIALICIPSIIMNWNIPEAADFFKAYGLYIGVIISTFIEEKWINFSLDVPIKNKIFRVILGALIALGLKTGLKLILPDINICSLIRYFVMGVVTMAVLPLAFKKEGQKE